MPSATEMKITPVPPRVRYIADGVRVEFVFGFAVYAAADLLVYLDAAPQSGGYAMAGLGQTAGGTVTFAVPPQPGQVVTLERRVVLQRQTDFLDSGDFAARSLNAELDYLAAALQQVAEDGRRAIHQHPTDAETTLTLPLAATRAGRALAFDSQGHLTLVPHGDSLALPDYLPQGVGAVWRGVGDKLRETVSVADFGALGDGVRDDTAAFQAALAAALRVSVPAGRYRITSPLVLGENRTLEGVGQGTVLVADGDDFPLIELPAAYATLRDMRLEGGEIGVFMLGRDGPCVQNALTDLVIWRAKYGLVLDGYDSPDRPCYWNNFDRVLVVKPRIHGIWLRRTGAGDSPNANRFHACRVYSLAEPTSGDGIRIEHGNHMNSFIDCEVNLHVTAQCCIRLMAGASKTHFYNPYTETLDAIANIQLEPGSSDTCIINLHSASAGPAIYDLSGGNFTAINAGYPDKHTLGQTRIRTLFVEALRYDTEYRELTEPGLVPITGASPLSLVSAFAGPMQAQLPPAEAGNGMVITIKKTDPTANSVLVTEQDGPGPDGRTIALNSRYDYVTVCSNGAAWWVMASNLDPLNASFVEGLATAPLDPTRRLHLISAFSGPVDALLPAPGDSGAVGRVLTIKKADASGHAVSITQPGGGGPDGGVKTLTSQYGFISVLSNGAAWHVVGRG